MKLTLARAAEFMPATGEFAPESLASGYSIDSRTLQSGDLFFAVRGGRLDGHDYVDAALAKGAIAAVIEKQQAERFPSKSRLLVVEDSLLALQRLGAAVRRLWGKPLIGVTGSAGKTSTKETIAHVLATRHRVLKSQGNLNNHFGMPLQLLKLEPEHEIAVIEMGMSHAGEISALAKLAEPDCGVVTMVAPVHLEFFESIAGIARAKYELIQSLPPGGIAVLNADDEYVSQFGRDFHGRVVMFGRHSSADVSAQKVESRGPEGSAFEIVADGNRAGALLPLLGEHNIYNALAGVAVGLQYGVSLQEAAGSLATLSAGDKRGEILHINGATVINDCYNSNPKALDSMVRSLTKIPAQRRIVVAGEMLELGPAGETMHRDSGRHMAEAGIDVVLGVRGLAQAIVEGARESGVQAEFLSTPEEAGEWLARELKPGDVVLLKASRGVRLERALEKVTREAPAVAH
ncbi:MAG TPA: UDP-N-acetylmuramoyl-tripeptide--D-alanyl-D-alanine ligase [Terriglobales bacterium]|jgi:UDP-N-acetylmuramoyl-tripeptide--D-alanyl-D-alanine ligase